MKKQVLSRLRIGLFKMTCAFLTTLSMVSCAVDDNESTDQDEALELPDSADLEQYRTKVINPYTVENMQLALDNLDLQVGSGGLSGSDKTRNSQDNTIKPNVYYIKFSPVDAKQESILKSDTTLALIDYPLGYEYDEQFFANRPALREGQVPEFYTTVEVTHKLPEKVPYTILEEMYIPQEDETNTGKTRSLKSSKGGAVDFVDLLLHQAFKQTDNIGLDGLGYLEDQKPNETKSRFLGIGIGSQWRPEGTIRIWDDIIGQTTAPPTSVFDHYEYYDCLNDPNKPEPLPHTRKFDERDMPGQQCRRAVYRFINTTPTAGSYVPLEGVQILLRDTFTVGNKVTDSNGYFRFDKTRGEKRYIIQWERYEYSIRDGALRQAEYHGPKKHSRWDHNIKGGDNEYFGHIHQGAYAYYYGNIDGLTRPPTNGFWKTQMKIAAFDSSGDSFHVTQFRNIPAMFRIALQYEGKNSEETIGLTIHELAHAAHWRIDKSAYNDLVHDAYIGPWLTPGKDVGPTERNNRRLLESWATGIEIYLTRKFYREHGALAYEYLNDNASRSFTGNYQLQRLDVGRGQYYTPILWDMIDIFNQRTGNGFVEISQPFDNVSGFTIKQLEDALKGANYWNKYRDHIINQNPGISTTANINQLFANWN